MLTNTYIYAKNLIASKFSNRDGMEMLQMVIIIAIAIGIGGVLYSIIGDENSGVLGTLKTKLTTKMTTFFGN